MIDNDFFETVCRMAPVGLFRTNVTGDIIYASKKFQDIVNLKESLLLGREWMSSIHKDDSKKVIESFIEAVKTESNWNIEFRFRTKTGDVTWVLGQASRINGGGKGMVGTITNVSQRKHILIELETMRETFSIK